MLRIPIFVSLALFFIAWICDVIIKSKSVLQIVQYTISCLLILYACGNLAIVANENYFIDIAIQNFNTGFLLISKATMPMAIISIISSLYYLFNANFKDKIYKFTILLFCGLYSISFTSSAIGIEICLSIYLIAHVCLFSNSVKNAKSVNRTIISSMLTYFLISFGMLIESYHWLFLLGIIAHSSLIPFSSRFLRLNLLDLRNTIVLNNIGMLFMFFIMITFTNHLNIRNLITNYGIISIIFGIILSLYGSYYALFEKCNIKSLIYFGFIANGFLFIIFGSLNLETGLNHALWYMLSMYFVMLILTMNRIILYNVDNIKSYIFNRNIEILCLLSLAGMPFLSQSYAKYSLMKEMGWWYIFLFFSQIVVIIFVLRGFKNLRSISFNKDSYNSIYKYLLIFSISIVFISAIKDTLISYHVFVVNFMIFFIAVGILWKLTYNDIDKINLEINEVDKFIFKSINSAIMIYNIILLYLNELKANLKLLLVEDFNLFKTVKNDMKRDIATHKSTNILISIIVVLGFSLVIKIFN